MTDNMMPELTLEPTAAAEAVPQLTLEPTAPEVPEPEEKKIEPVEMDEKLLTDEEKKAVECGYWHLYRYDPRRIAEGKNPFQLDSPAPDSGKMMDYLKGENRYASLQINFPDRAQRLYEKTVQDAKDRYAKYRKMAED